MNTYGIKKLNKGIIPVIKETHYTPDIEEFCVGYQCEMKNSSDPTYFDWEPVEFLDDFDFIMGTSMNDYDFAYLRKDLIEGNFRTPHLTVEQLIEEGWTLDEEDSYQQWEDMIFHLNRRAGSDSTRNGGIWMDGHRYVFEIIFRTNSNTIQIIEHAFGGFTGNSHDQRVLFNGICKSINDYRKIIKQLNIERWINLTSETKSES